MHSFGICQFVSYIDEYYVQIGASVDVVASSKTIALPYAPAHCDAVHCMAQALFGYRNHKFDTPLIISSECSRRPHCPYGVGERAVSLVTPSATREKPVYG